MELVSLFYTSVEHSGCQQSWQHMDRIQRVIHVVGSMNVNKGAMKVNTVLC